MMIEGGGPPQSNKKHTCCNYILGFRGKTGKIFKGIEGDHYGGHGGSQDDISDDGVVISKVPAFKPGEIIGLKMVLLRGLKGSDGKQNNTRLIGYIDRNNNGKWQKFYDYINPCGTKDSDNFPVITEILCLVQNREHS